MMLSPFWSIFPKPFCDYRFFSISLCAKDHLAGVFLPCLFSHPFLFFLIPWFTLGLDCFIVASCGGLISFSDLFLFFC